MNAVACDFTQFAQDVRLGLGQAGAEAVASVLSVRRSRLGSFRGDHDGP